MITRVTYTLDNPISLKHHTTYAYNVGPYVRLRSRY